MAMNTNKRPFLIASETEMITDKPNQDIIPKQKNGEPYAFYTFEMMNNETCTISVNESKFFELKAKRGLRFGVHDPLIYSVIIKEEDTTYSFIGGC